MRIVTYKCDLCKEEIQDLEKLKTVYWNIVNHSYTLIPVIKSDHYDKQICLSCIEMIKKLSL